MVPVNFVAVVLWETRNEVDAPGQHIRRQMALHIPFEAFRILRLLFYGKVQFTTSVRSINRQYHSVTAMLVKRFNASYTASKGALEEAWKMFNMYRDWLATDFCQPVYEEWLTEAVAKGRIKAPGFFTDAVIRKAYCTAKWNGPAKGMLDPVKEVTAAEKRVQNGFSTRSDETMQMTGSGYYSKVEQLKQEEKELRDVRKIANGNADDPATG